MVLLEADATLREIVARLVRAVDPDKLVLFGSRAAGRARPGSDYDVLIVKAEPDPRQRRTGPLYQHLWGIPEAVDLQVRQHVATQALRDGVVVYEKQNG